MYKTNHNEKNNFLPFTYSTHETCVCFFHFDQFTDGSEKLSDNSPGAASITSVEIANEFASLSNEEQDRLRAEWSQVIR